MLSASLLLKRWQQKTRPARRRTGFVCPARYLQAEANLSLAAFIERPQAEAQIGALKFYQSASRSINGVYRASTYCTDDVDEEIVRGREGAGFFDRARV